MSSLRTEQRERARERKVRAEIMVEAERAHKADASYLSLPCPNESCGRQRLEPVTRNEQWDATCEKCNWPWEVDDDYRPEPGECEPGCDCLGCYLTK